MKDEIHPCFVFLTIIHSLNEEQHANFYGIFVLKSKNPDQLLTIL